MVRPSQRLFPVLRSGLRANLVARSVPRSPVGRRMASSHAGHSSGGNEKYWRIGAALTFGPALLYLLSPAARKTAHKHTIEHIHEHEVEPVSATAAHTGEPPMTDDEGTEVTGEEIKESIERAIAEDSPTHAQAHEEEVTASPSGSSSQSESTSEGNPDSDTTQESNPGSVETENVSTAEAEDSQKETLADAESETEKPAQPSAGES
ncbi:hypothetical protein F5141DRAFT_1103919 [Pisolithus sp. B1]|nr:hypothetical protein F5141DRAFT_1103919 [Pisolithus sp. B1]